MEKSLFEQMGGTYYQQGDYFLPNLSVPETVPIGIWGQRHLRYIKKYRRAIYTAMLLSGKLDTYLSEIDWQADDMFSQLVNQLTEQEGITEQLKATDQIKWVCQMRYCQDLCAKKNAGSGRMRSASSRDVFQSRL